MRNLDPHQLAAMAALEIRISSASVSSVTACATMRVTLGELRPDRIEHRCIQSAADEDRIRLLADRRAQPARVRSRP